MFERFLQSINAGRAWLTESLSALSPQQKALLFRGVPVLLIALGIGLYFLQRVYYRPLFTDLSPQDAAAVVRELDARHIPYQLRNNGTAIDVPEEVLHHTRLEMAGKGIPLGGGVGFEIFEQTPFGATEFSQKVNYQRALQGELARTINSISAVQSSRVHLALPSRGAFLGREEKPSASVVLELKPGSRLTAEQAQGIINLLSSSVEGLTPERVTVVDTSGRPLRSKEAEKDTETEFIHRLKLNIEQEMERRIESMLEPVLGAGKSVARVSAELEFRETQVAREEFNPAHVVRSQQQQSEGTEPDGVPGAQANLPNGDTTAKGPISSRKSETVNYEIGKTTSQVIEPRGQVRRLSVAVMVDGKYEANVYTPRSPEEMEILKAIVLKAVGFNAERGDQIEVATMPFTKMEEPAVLPMTPIAEVSQWAQTPIGMGAIGGGVLLLLVLLKLVFKRRPTPQEPEQIPTQSEHLTLEGELPAEEEQEMFPNRVEKITIASNPQQAQLAQIAQDYPEMTVQLIRTWLRDGRKTL